MAGVLIRKIATLNLSIPKLACESRIHTSACVLAARKGTREKARKKKVKVELKKVGFIPHNQRDALRLKSSKVSKRSVDKEDEEALDKVFLTKNFKIVEYGIRDAVSFHREVNHPTMRNKPNAPVNVVIELNMVAEKKTRFMDSFHRIVNLPHPFGSYEDRSTLAFCKTPEQIMEAEKAGADLVGGVDLVQRIQSGDVSVHEFKYVVSHPAMLPELIPIRGLLKRKFPQAKSGTLGPDLTTMVQKFKLGLQYKCEKDADEHDLGIVNVPIGNLQMETDHLEANFIALVKDVEEARPKRSGDFITWVWCISPPSPERFKINHLKIIQELQ